MGVLLDFIPQNEGYSLRLRKPGQLMEKVKKGYGNENITKIKDETQESKHQMKKDFIYIDRIIFILIRSIYLISRKIIFISPCF